MAPKGTCPNLLSQGACTDSGCKYQHKLLESHNQSRPRRDCISGKNVTHSCRLCQVNVGAKVWDQHIKGSRHKKLARLSGVAPEVNAQQGINLEGQKYCDLCKYAMTANNWTAHQRSPQHIRREKFLALKTVLDEAERSKNGIIIDGDLDFGIVDPAQSRNARVTAIIKILTPDVRFKLISLKLVSPRGVESNAFTVAPENSNRHINSTASVKLVVKLKQTHVGRYEDRLELTFEDLHQSRRKFLISRPIRAVIGDKEDHEKLKPKVPYIPRPRAEKKAETRIIEGKKPPPLKIIPYVGRLPMAEIPKDLLSILSEDSTTKDIISRVRKDHMPGELDTYSYAPHFRPLIWIEEHRTDEDLQQYDIPDAKIKKHNTLYYISVPGLAEKRPSVLLGDRILVQRHGDPEGHWFEGFVRDVREKDVGLGLSRSFRSGWNENQRYYVRFKVGRIPYRRQHQALEAKFKEERVLFPLEQHALSLPRLQWRPPSKFYNSDIGTNPQQVQAVMSIVKLPPGSPTFVVFGPFGTGKTSTMVEAILQVLGSNPQARILACAPSNSGADLITTKLSPTLDKEAMFRVVAPSLYKSQVPEEVKKYTYMKDDTYFSVPTTNRIQQFNVIVSTCVSAAIVSGVGVPRGHFTHIFIDEAGYASEPEAMVSIKMLANSKTNVILAGDPKQLGPVIRSPVARELGLHKSYLERLMDREAYDIGLYSGATVVKLLHNYRSHPAILKFPNEQFYGGELQVKAKAEKINKYLGSPLLPSPKFPIIFNAVYGKDEREASSPSYFNVDEVSQVRQYVQDLLATGNSTTGNDIGIIAPYRAQCQKIREALQRTLKGIKGIKVGGVEEFQGQERPVIIISAVRSSKDLIDFDLRHTLGFVANPRRFNVAVTRTQALLIVIGDPQVLSLDPLWRSFLNYVYNNGGWKGPDPDWDTNVEVNMEGGYDKAVRERAQLDMNELTHRMEVLTMEGVDDEDAEQIWRDDIE